MKNFITICAMFLCCVAFVYVATRSANYRIVRATPQSAPAAPRLPRTFNKTVAFMPGQATNIPNSHFKVVEIRSEYPLRVMTGPCHEDYTVEFFCNAEAADIFISDTRRMPLFFSPKANTVTVTLTEF